MCVRFPHCVRSVFETSCALGFLYRLEHKPIPLFRRWLFSSACHCKCSCHQTRLFEPGYSCRPSWHGVQRARHCLNLFWRFRHTESLTQTLFEDFVFFIRASGSGDKVWTNRIGVTMLLFHCVIDMCTNLKCLNRSLNWRCSGLYCCIIFVNTASVWM